MSNHILKAQLKHLFQLIQQINDEDLIALQTNIHVLEPIINQHHLQDHYYTIVLPPKLSALHLEISILTRLIKPGMTAENLVKNLSMMLDKNDLTLDLRKKLHLLAEFLSLAQNAYVLATMIYAIDMKCDLLNDDNALLKQDVKSSLRKLTLSNEDKNNPVTVNHCLTHGLTVLQKLTALKSADQKNIKTAIADVSRKKNISNLKLKPMKSLADKILEDLKRIDKNTFISLSLLINHIIKDPRLSGDERDTAFDLRHASR